MSNEKRLARFLQEYTGARYSTALQWARAMRAKGLITEATNPSHPAQLRVAFHMLFPAATCARDAS